MRFKHVSDKTGQRPFGPLLRAGILVAALVSIALICVAFFGTNFFHPSWFAGASKSASPEHLPLTVVVSGDTMGWIVPCGCTAKQAGGLLRRGTFVANLRHERSVLLADAGGSAGGTSRYESLKFAAICRGEVAMGIAAHNLGAAELALGAEAIRQIASDTDVPFVSTNVATIDGDRVAKESLEVTVGGQRVGILGVIGPQFAAAGFRIEAPRESIARRTAALRKTCDLILVLAYLPEDQLEALAAGLPDVDLVIGGPTQQSIAPRLAGRTTWAAATAKGKFVVRLEMSADSTKNANSGWSGGLVEMGDALADHPQQRENLQRFYDQLRTLDLPANETGFAPRLPREVPEGFRIAGTDRCRDCHEPACDAWDTSSHAHAWKTLLEKQSHIDPYCQQCHTTGYGLPNGFFSLAQSREQVNVGCESCHGPSESHAQNAAVRTPYDAKDRCSQCHDPENSPRFQFTEYWQRIVHGEGKGAP